MEISSLLNLEVVSENPARWYGLITDLKIRDNRIVSCVIKNGSRFTPSVFLYRRTSSELKKNLYRSRRSMRSGVI